MTDQPTTRDQLIEQAAQVLEDAYLGGSESSWTLMARALADAGLLADPERRDEFINWTLGRVRKALGTPDGRAVSMHAGEVAAELKQLRAKVDDLAAERDLAVWLHAEAVWQRHQVGIENSDLQGEIEEVRVYAAQHHHQPNPEWTLRDLLVDFVERLKVERDALQRQVDGFKRVRDDVDELLIAALGPHAEPGGGGWYADVSQLIAERDLARWLHAELQHKLTLPCGSCHPCMNWADETWRRADRKPPTVGRWEDKLAETRGLYARLDDAIKLIEEMAGHLRQDAALTIGVETRLAALRADEPAEPETGCMNGPAKQHTLHMVGIIKALKSAAGMDQLPTEPPRRDNFARLARAIADYWPREIDRPSSEPTGEVDRG